MTLQGLAVALIVPLCAGHGAWTLLGSGMRLRMRRWLAARALLPAAWSRRLLRAGSASHGCNCDGCAHHPSQAQMPAPPTQAIVQLHRRRT